jgi:hypothetical protein
MVLDSLKTIKKMSIEEKISFWQNVMQYAKDRGIDIYFITWNIAMNSVAPPGNWMQQKPHPDVSIKGGQYGITNEQDNTTTMDYVRASVRELLLTYPLLKGIGVTAGENMVHRKDKFAKEQWLWRTYGLGIMDAKKRQSDRTVYFLHRVWQGGLDDIMQDFAANYPDPFSIGFKYARAHMYSSTRPPFANQILQEMDDYKVKCWWNLRNDDIFNFRWGDPDYVREFLSNLPPENKTAGYHMGSDGYVWGREFTSLDPDDPRQLELEKHWFSFMLWGRLGYDLNLSNNHFQDMLEYRFPQMQSKLLYNAWASASKIIPLVNRFHWRNWDYMWAVEGCMDQRKGFHTVQDFIDTEPMKGSDLLSIPQAVKRVNSTKSSSEQTPLQVADSLYKYANTSIKTMESILREYNVEDKELQHTLDDIRAMSYLGRYYGSKIRGAYYLQRAHISKQPNWIKKTLQELIDALEHWRLYAKTASQLYKPQMLARTRQLDWYERLTDASEDLSIVTRNGHEDWVSLFNGRDLSGWSVQCLPEDKKKTYWSVDNGSILANSMGDPDHDYIWLVTDKEYNDFVLDLKFQTYRQVTGNIGIQIRSRYDTRAGWLDGPQVDIAPPLPWRTGMMYDETRGYRRWISPNIEKGNWVDSTLSNPNLKFFYADDKNQWNTIRLYAIGNKVAVILNGIPINTLTENNILDDSIHLERQVGMQGHIALQIHKNDELKIRFKDIKILEFK